MSYSVNVLTATELANPVYVHFMTIQKKKRMHIQTSYPSTQSHGLNHTLYIH